MPNPVNRWNYKSKFWDDISGWSLGKLPDANTDAIFGAAASLAEPRMDVVKSADVKNLTVSNSNFKFRILSATGVPTLDTLTVYGNFKVTAASYIYVAAGELDLRGVNNAIDNTTVYLGYNVSSLPIPKNVGLLSDDQATRGNLVIGANAKVVGTFGDFEWYKGKVVNKGSILVDPVAAGDAASNVETLNMHIALLDNTAGTISLADHHTFSGSPGSLLGALVADGFEDNASSPFTPKTFDSLSIGDPFAASGPLDVVRGGKIAIDGGVLNLRSVRLKGSEIDFNHVNGSPSVLHISNRVALNDVSLHGVASTDNLAFDKKITSLFLNNGVGSPLEPPTRQELVVQYSDFETRTFHLYDSSIHQASFVTTSSNNANYSLISFS